MLGLEAVLANGSYLRLKGGIPHESNYSGNSLGLARLPGPVRGLGCRQPHHRSSLFTIRSARHQETVGGVGGLGVAVRAGGLQGRGGYGGGLAVLYLRRRTHSDFLRTCLQSIQD